MLVNFNSIRLRLALAFLLVFGLLASLSVTMLRASLKPGFLAMEQINAIDDANRVVSGIDAQLGGLEILMRDWANWDDMYQFAQKPNPAFVTSNMSAGSLQSASLNFVVIFDANGNTVAESAATPGEAKVEPSDLLTLIRKAPPRQSCGLWQGPHQLLLLCWSAILQSDHAGPSTGTLVMARPLNDAMLRKIATQAKVPFELLPFAPSKPGMGSSELDQQQHLQGTTVFSSASEGALTLDYPLLDLKGDPLSLVRLKLPRNWLEQGERMIVQSAWQLGMLALACGVLLLGALHFWLVLPLQRLQGEVSSIRTQRDWKKQIAAFRRDEIGDLSVEINGLLHVIHTQMEQMESLAMTDALTRLSNRRRFDNRLDEELDRVQRSGNASSLLLMDIDFFKQYNDHYGHPGGDVALQSLAQVLREVTRRVDFAARVGGEEFALVLPDTGLAGARQMAAKVKTALSLLALAHEKSQVSPYLTVSIGIAVMQPNHETKQNLLERVDKALYAAKQGGRNRYSVGPESFQA
jgi:diguanylate cyclase (GGDEF)-like protein